MKVAKVIWLNDFKSIVRDQTVSALLVVPLIFLALLRFGFPLAQDQWPELGDYEVVVLALFCLVVGMFPAFMMSFVMIDERDQGLLSVFRVLPISTATFLRTRVMMVVLIGLLYPLILLVGAGLGDVGVVRMVVLTVLCSWSGATGMIIALALAKNKVECLTVFKALYVVVAISATGALGDFEGWNVLPGVIPTYWVFSAFEAAGTGDFVLASLVAVLLNVVFMGLFYRVYRRNL